MTLDDRTDVDLTSEAPGAPDQIPPRTVPAPERGRRRPSGEPPPLPHELGRSGRFWLLMGSYVMITLLAVILFGPLRRWAEQTDTLLLRGLASTRSRWLTDTMLLITAMTSRWTIRVLRWGTILGLVVFRRWRHLVVFVGTIIVLEILANGLGILLGRARPFGVEIIGGWTGYSMPSRPPASLAVTLIGIAYALVVPGRPRGLMKWAIGIVLGLVVLARMYLAVDQPSSAVSGAILGVAVGLIAFRWFTPNDVFPVTYRRGKSAHLDVTGPRGEAIRRAAEDQLGLVITDVKPVGLKGSGGSTPLRLRIAATQNEPEHYAFAKLYAKSHVRADRWYKLGRSILYGALEDEAPFQSVRRFVEYEDYTLRLLHEYGTPSPRPGGVAEITPEREYMILMEFFDDAVEIGDAEIDDRIIDEGLQLVRRLWDVGLAHRDVKPANLMVQDGHLRLIDVFFVQVRPSPWRQAVDLANMMLVLALRSDADRVYQRALTYFTPDEIGEAFAATRGVASPTQLRSSLKQDGRDLQERFQAMAPPHPRVSIQRWSVRRVVRTVGVLLVALLALVTVLGNWAVFA